MGDLLGCDITGLNIRATGKWPSYFTARCFWAQCQRLQAQRVHVEQGQAGNGWRGELLDSEPWQACHPDGDCSSTSSVVDFRTT